MRRILVVSTILLLVSSLIVIGCSSKGGSSIWTRGYSDEQESDSHDRYSGEEDYYSGEDDWYGGDDIYASISGLYRNADDAGDVLALYDDGIYIFAYGTPYEEGYYTADRSSMTLTLDAGGTLYFDTSYAELVDDYGNSYSRSTGVSNKEFFDMLKKWDDLNTEYLNATSESEKDRLKAEIKKLDDQLKAILDQDAERNKNDLDTEDQDQGNEGEQAIYERIAGDWVYDPGRSEDRFGITFYQDGTCNTGYGVGNMDLSYTIDAGSMTINVNDGQSFTIGSDFSTLTTPEGKVLVKGDWRDPNRAI